MNGDELVLPVVELKGRAKRLWFITPKTFKVCRLDKYKGKLEKFDPNTFTVYDKKGQRLSVYTTKKLATIASLKKQKAIKKDKWDELTDEVMKISKDIEKLIDEIQALEGDND